MIILDTNVISEPLRAVAEPRVIAWLDSLDESDVWLTAITAAELRAGVEKLQPGARRESLDAQVRAIVDDEFLDRILPFDIDAAECYGTLVGPKLRHGLVHQNMDFQIAAIAVVHGATLATRNAKDFSGIGVQLIDPWDA